MIKLLRTGATSYPMVWRFFMLFIALAFVGTMGWVGLSAPTSDSVAEVDDLEISLSEFRQGQDNLRDFYRSQLKESYSEDLLKQLNINIKKNVMDQLIEQRVWLKYAHDIGLTVSDAEVRDRISNIPSFQTKGRFDSKIYDRFLLFRRTTHAIFEEDQRETLLIRKAKGIVRDSVGLTDQEIQREINQQNPSSGTKEKTIPELTQRKQNRAVYAFTEALKTKAIIKIKDGVLDAPIPSFNPVTIEPVMSPSESKDEEKSQTPTPIMESPSESPSKQ